MYIYIHTDTETQHTTLPFEYEQMKPQVFLPTSTSADNFLRSSSSLAISSGLFVTDSALLGEGGPLFPRFPRFPPVGGDGGALVASSTLPGGLGASLMSLGRRACAARPRNKWSYEAAGKKNGG